nr:ectoderm neural cortex protein 1 [Hymenolepis microstoma]
MSADYHLSENLSENGISNGSFFLENSVSQQVAVLLHGLEECRQKQLYTDVILCASDEEFPCHKVVLASSSRYFSAMFMTPFSEQQTSRVNLKQISPWALRYLLDFAYTGRLTLSTAVVQDLFVAANLLDYPLAVNACIDFMKRHLHVSNCLGVQLLAEAYELHDLAKSARTLAVENFSTLVNPGESTLEEWLQLPLKSVESYLCSDDLEVRSEKVVLEACLVWVAHEPEKRVCHLSDLLHHVRLQQLSPGLLRTYIESTSSIIRESPAALSYIEEIISSMESSNHIAPSSVNCNTIISSTSLQPRPSTLKRPTLVAVGGISSTFILDSVDAFSFVRGRCLTCPAMPVNSLMWFSAAVADNILIITGGIRAGEILSSVYRFNVQENTWSQGRNMPIARARHASVAVRGGHVFLFGGVTVSPPNVSTYHMASENAQRVLSEGDEENGIAETWGGEVPDLQLVSTISRYDVAKDEWVTAGHSRYPRQMSSIAVVSPVRVDEESSCNRSTGDRDSADCHSSASFYTVVEMGGSLDTEMDVVSEKMAIYIVRPNFTVDAADDYIALTRQVRYAKCVANQSGSLVYIFWEATGELSVLDFHRQSLRTLRPLTEPEKSERCSVHCGCAWVGGRLYVVGGFSAFLGAGQRRPIAPRCSIHCYDPDTDTCIIMECKQTPDRH